MSDTHAHLATSRYALGIAGEPTSLSIGRLHALAIDRDRADLAARLAHLAMHGIRYSGEDFDIMGAVWAELGWPR